MKFNEDSRVKIPAILHLMRLGYKYLSLKNAKCDESTNIFTDIFDEAVKRLNPAFDNGDVKRLYDELSISLENEDLGKVFFEKLIDRSGTRLIDFENFENNSFHVVTELPMLMNGQVRVGDVKTCLENYELNKLCINENN